MNATPANARFPSPLSLGIVTSRFVESCEFYFEHFEFRPVDIADTRATLEDPRGSRLTLLRSGDRDQPAAWQERARGNGFWLQLEVPDPAATHRHLRSAGAEIVAELNDPGMPADTFIARDPNGVLIRVTKSLSNPSHLTSSQHRKKHDQRHRHPVHGLPRHRNEARPRFL